MTVTTDRPANGAKPDVEALYRNNRERLVRIAEKGAPNRDAAEDAVQEAFVRALADPDRVENLGGFVNSTARFRALKESSHRGKQKPVGDAIDRLAVTAATDEDGTGRVPCMGDPGTVAQVEAALAALPERDAAAVRRHFLDGRPVSAIAKEFGLSATTVYAAINRSLTRLRELGLTLDDGPDSESADIAGALAVLAPRQQLALRLRFVEGLSYREAGERMGTNQNSACCAAQAGIKRLRKLDLLPAAWAAALGDVKPQLKRRRGPSSVERVETAKALLPGWRTQTPSGTEIKAALGLTSDSVAWKIKGQLAADAGLDVPAEPAPDPVVDRSISEAWLRWADQLVTCMFVHADESTSRHPVTFASMPAAKREATGHLIEQGYRPDGPWVDTPGADESMRQFKPSEAAS